VNDYQQYHPKQTRGKRVLARPLNVGLLVLLMLMLTAFAATNSMNARFDAATTPKDAQQITAEEERVEAAFIWQFLQFIEFPAPASPQETFVIGIIGTTRVELFLSNIVRQRQLADGRAVEVRKISNPEEMLRCNVIFVAPTETPRLPLILGKMRGKSTLTIGRDDEFLERGGLMNFYVENARVRFEYNADELPNSKLRFSSKLLRLGRQFTKK
jgi:YfiR/HmsC-like